MNTICYLLDENVDPLYRLELLKREPTLTVWKIGLLGTPARGTLDPDVLRWCEENCFVLVTNNRRSMPQHLRDHLESGGHIPGILIMNSKMSVGETIDELLLIWGASTVEEYQDRIVHLPIK